MKIRVGTGEGHSSVIDILKSYDYITLLDIQAKIPNKRIIGWCKLEKSKTLKS